MVCILGIETSCDETSAAVVVQSPGERPCIRSNIVWGQSREHASFGGVVPEIAARAHVEVLDLAIETALVHADIDVMALDAVAATAGPGLIGGLIIGLTTGKAVAAAIGKPLLPINHLEGHALVARLTHDVKFPYLLLLISGGHTQILFVRGLGDFMRWATTLDDALGEAFDKVARILELPFPGGANVEKSALSGDSFRFLFPRPMKGRADPNFSFSGLKTAVWRVVNALPSLSRQDIADVCSSFQGAVSDVLCDRVSYSMQHFLRENPELEHPSFVVAGGVAANKKICDDLATLSSSLNFQFIAPPQNLCGDNAAMIAWAALERFQAGLFQNDAMSFLSRSRWPLDVISTPMIGSGRRGIKV